MFSCNTLYLCLELDFSGSRDLAPPQLRTSASRARRKVAPQEPQEEDTAAKPETKINKGERCEKQGFNRE